MLKHGDSFISDAKKSSSSLPSTASAALEEANPAQSHPRNIRTLWWKQNVQAHLTKKRSAHKASDECSKKQKILALPEADVDLTWGRVVMSNFLLRSSDQRAQTSHSR